MISKMNLVKLQGQKNKILKPPFKEFAEEIPILYQKQFYFMKRYPISKITSDPDLSGLLCREI